MPALLEWLLSALLLFGGAFMLLGSWGLWRLPDFYTRLHAPTKATTLGLAALLLASSLIFSITRAGLSLHELLIAFFLLLTAPVSAHMLAKTALHHQLPLWEKTRGKGHFERARQRQAPEKTTPESSS